MLNWIYCAATKEDESWRMYRLQTAECKEAAAVACIKKDMTWMPDSTYPSHLSSYRSDDLMPLRPRVAENGLVSAWQPCLPHPAGLDRCLRQISWTSFWRRTITDKNCRCGCHVEYQSLRKLKSRTTGYPSFKDLHLSILRFATSL